MKTIEERRLALLEETIKHFNSTNRCVNLKLGGNGCQYSPIEGKSEGCAIGRLIKDKDLCKKFDAMEMAVDSHDLFRLLPIELQELGKYYLRILQQLHDDKDSWNENGLSEIGIESVNNLKKIM